MTDEQLADARNVIQQLTDTLEAVRDMCANNPALQDRSYIDLGVRSNKAVRLGRAALAATPPSVEPHPGSPLYDVELPGMWESADFLGGETDMQPQPGSASSEAAGDARILQRAHDMIHALVSVFVPSNDGAYNEATNLMAGIREVLATPATQASNAPMSISGAAGPLGEPEILGAEPADDPLQIALDALGEIALAGMSLPMAAGGDEDGDQAWRFHAQQAWKFIRIAAVAKEKSRAATSANTTKETE